MPQRIDAREFRHGLLAADATGYLALHRKSVTLQQIDTNSFPQGIWLGWTAQDDLPGQVATSVSNTSCPNATRLELMRSGIGLKQPATRLD